MVLFERKEALVLHWREVLVFFPWESRESNKGRVETDRETCEKQQRKRFFLAGKFLEKAKSQTERIRLPEGIKCEKGYCNHTNIRLY